VDSVFTRAEVAAQAMPAGRPEAWSLLDRLRASYDPDRSPDLFVNLKANVTPIPDPTNGYVATHGSVWDYDRKVPILFWWKGAPREDRPESAMTVEIMPTLAAMIGVPIGRGEVDGRCLRIASIACPR
jgi:predicted AlkP superfamily pyrophosphatase or phosphodiesterase